MAAIEIGRRDLDAAGLRRAAGRSRDAAAARRMLALALVLELDQLRRGRDHAKPESTASTTR